MAKQQVYKLDNGATIIYQKQSAFNGYSFSIGFRCGSQLDGKYKGLSHALEHMLVKAQNYKSTQKYLDDMLKYTINQNAFTTQHTICVSDFTAVDKNIDDALAFTQKMLSRKHFSKDQLAREIEVIKQEILMDKEEHKFEIPSAFDCLLTSLCENPPKDIDILGNAKTLKLLTPELLSSYVKRYFNSDNLVISVTTNKSVEKVFELCSKYILSTVQPATNPKYIIPPPEPPTFKPANTLVAMPDAECEGVSICLMFRERSAPAEDINLEYAYGTIEDYLLNNSGSMLWNVLREKNQLVYTYGFQNMNLGNVKFKSFYTLTSSAKMRKTIYELCKMIRSIATNGITEKQFNDVKTALTDIKSATLSKFKASSAQSNYFDYIEGKEFIDYKKVNDYISKITYQDFCKYIMSVYATANVSVAIEGKFDSRKCYNLLEIEKMLGNYSHVENTEDFNTPRIEVTNLAPQAQIFTLDDYNNYLMQLAQYVSAEKPKPESVTIDNEPVK